MSFIQQNNTSKSTIQSIKCYLLLSLFAMVVGYSTEHTDRSIKELEQKIQNGDLIFQTSKSNQSKAIQLATNSRYSHVGIIYEISGKFFVFEAVQPVKLTPLKSFINNGEKSYYVVKRLKNASSVLTKSSLKKMQQVGEQYLGKPYDIYFGWSNDRIYCSELVWKIYDQAFGIQIGELMQLSDFDLTHEVVKAKISERYGDKVPLNEKVISPQAIFASSKLKTIAKN